MKIREGFVAVGDIEESVQQVRARTWTWNKLHFGSGLEFGCDDMSNIIEGSGDASDGVQYAGAPIHQDSYRQPGDVFYRDVVALFLALTEQTNGLAFGSKLTKAVRTVTGMGIARAVDQG